LEAYDKEENETLLSRVQKMGGGVRKVVDEYPELFIRRVMYKDEFATVERTADALKQLLEAKGMPKEMPTTAELRQAGAGAALLKAVSAFCHRLSGRCSWSAPETKAAPEVSRCESKSALFGNSAVDHHLHLSVSPKNTSAPEVKQTIFEETPSYLY
jgi:hypothetical protein